MAKAPKTLTLPAKCRLGGVGTFSRIISRRFSASDAVLVAYAVTNELGHNRIGVSVGRKFGAAVQRNRIKRLIREAFRLNQTELPAGYDIIFVPRVGANRSLNSVRDSLLDTARRAIARAGRGSSA